VIRSWLANIFGSDARCDMLEQDSANSNGEKQRMREEPRQAQTRAACSPPARGRQRRRVGDRSLSAPIRPSESDRCRSSPSPPTQTQPPCVPLPASSSSSHSSMSPHQYAAHALVIMAGAAANHSMTCGPATPHGQ
jgi:hypothetical protein